MEMVVFVGAQGVGKSTYYSLQFSNTHVRVNLDMLKTRHREHQLITTCLAMRQRMVIDNTNPTRADRARYIPLAKAAGFTVVGYVFSADFETLIQRNAERTGPYRIPEVGIKSTLKKLEVPTFDEPFDALFAVQPLNHGQFQTTRM